MSTESETGWSQPSSEGFYWMRKGDYKDLIETSKDGWLVGFKVSGRIEEFVNGGYEFLGPITPANTEQLAALREETVNLRVDQQAVRKLYDLPDEGDFYEQMADHLEYDVVDEVRLQNAVWNLLTETFYEEGLKNNGVAVKFLMRLHLLAHEAKLPEYSKDNPIVAEALAALGDPATNSPESLAAAALRNALGTEGGLASE